MCRVGSGDPDGSCSGPKKQNGGGARSKGERAISAESSRSDAISAELSYPIPLDFPDSDRTACEYGIEHLPQTQLLSNVGFILTVPGCGGDCHLNGPEAARPAFILAQQP